MAIGDLNPASWRIDVYDIKADLSFGGYITDLSNFYTSDLSITKQRNYPDEVQFTLDLQQLEERADALGIESRDVLEPYNHKVKIYRNNEFVMQAIVVKVDVNLNNNSKNTVEVSCVDILGLFEKRLIHQDYGHGSWADFAKEVVYDAQHEPNRIYNYSFEGDGTAIDNAWFRGWKYLPGEETLKHFPEWQPNHLYSMYDTCTYDAKFWEAKEHAFVSGEEFSESNWTLLGVVDPETGDVAGVYGAWREDDEEVGPTGTALGGWGGTSSCHVTAKTFQITNGDITSINMANSFVSTSLVAPIAKDSGAPILPDGYEELEYIQNDYGATSESEIAATIDTGVNPKDYSGRLKISVDLQALPGVSSSTCHTIAGVTEGVKNGSWTWHPQYHFAYLGNSKLYMEFPISSGTYQFDTGYTINTNRHTYIVDTTGYDSDNGVNYVKVTVDKALLGTTTQTMTTCPNQTIFLNARNYVTPNSSYPRGGYGLPCKLYGCQIYSESGSLIRYFIPCKKTQGSVVGMFDVVYGKFYPSATAKSYTAGPVVPYARQSDAKIHTRVMLRNATSSLNFISYQYGSQEIITNFDMSTASTFLQTEASDQLTAKVVGLYASYRANDKFLKLRYMLHNGEDIVLWNNIISTEAVSIASRAGVGPDIKSLLDTPPTVNKEDYMEIRSTYDFDVSKVKFYIEGYGGVLRQYTQEFTISQSGWTAVEYDFSIPGFDIYRFGFCVTDGDIIADTPLCYIKPVEGDVWDLGVRIGDFPSVSEQEDNGWLRNRTTSTYEWKNAKETLLDLSNMDSDNFWYEIDENYRFNLWVDRGKKTVEVNLSYPKNITSMTVSTNANDVYNYIKGDGSAEVSQDPLVSGVANSNGAPFTWIGYDVDSMEKYWALAEALSFNSERAIDTLQNDIRTEIKTASMMQDVPTVKISNNAITPDQIGLGDIVSVEAIDIPYVHRVNGLYKIISYDIDVDIDGNESISLTLINPTENQINSLSFPQLIKNMQNRLKGIR